MAEAHAALGAAAALVGTWRGDGVGEYPTIEDFDYSDEWTFSHSGKPFIGFVERTSRHGAPAHTESGYLRFTGPGALEIVAALPTGQSENGVGTVTERDDGVLVETRAQVANTPSSKRVDEIVRRYLVQGDSLLYEMEMAAVGQGLTLHLRAHLSRVSD